MSIKTRGLITLTVEKEITEIRTFYKATSTNVSPSIPVGDTSALINIITWTNAGWSTTEPAFNIATPYVWMCMQSLYGTYDEDHTAVSLSSSYTAAVDTRILTNNISSRTVGVWTNYNEITDTEDSSITIPAGMYVFSNPSVNYTKTSTYDHNLYLNSTGLFLRYKTANLARYNIDGVHLYAATNGIQYRRSTDTTVIASKTYFTISGTHFVRVANPSGNPVTNGYYEASTTSLQTNPLIELTYDIVESGVTPTLKNRLTFYDPDTSYRAMELTNNELAFYNINSSNDKVASLSTNGLILTSGGIIARTAGQNGYVYLSSEDNTNSITINGHTPAQNDPKWRQVIGTKFGVDSEGNLYANSANISGVITISSGSNVYTKTEADTAFDVSGAAATAEQNAISSANSYTDTATQDMATTADIPTKVSDLDNDSEFQTQGQVESTVNTATYDMATQTYVTSQGYQNATQVSGAISTATNSLAAKSDAVYRTQKIYRRYTEAQPNLTGPAIWVTASSDSYSNWSTKIDQLTNNNTKYPFLYTATQTQTVSQYETGDHTSCTCTTPILDDSTTVIDGGNIITNSVTAEKLNATDINASNSLTIGALTSATQTSILNSELSDDIAVAATTTKYITKIDNSGIKVQPYNDSTSTVDANNYITITNNGLNVYKGGVSVAEYGDTARIGKTNDAAFLINSNSLQAYYLTDPSDSTTRTKYFEVTPTSMTYGTNIVASQTYASGQASAAQSAAEQTAQQYAATAQSNASYLVEIEVRNIDYTTPTATLFAHVYHLGTELTSSTTESISSITFQWAKVVEVSGTPTTYEVQNISGATSQSLAVSDLNTTYICVIDKSSN